MSTEFGVWTRSPMNETTDLLIIKRLLTTETGRLATYIFSDLEVCGYLRRISRIEKSSDHIVIALLEMPTIGLDWSITILGIHCISRDRIRYTTWNCRFRLRYFDRYPVNSCIQTFCIIPKLACVEYTVARSSTDSINYSFICGLCYFDYPEVIFIKACLVY